ncbi:MAG: DnaJ C-terminal domain-containing protein, partial [Geminicoccaceae bacterium]
MAEDLYNTLGVSRQASQDEIKRQYRKLAKALHPDLNPDDKAVAERFKRVSAAHSILSDPKKRASYDLGEIDENGEARHHGFGQHGFGGGRRGGHYQTGGGTLDDETLHDLFAEMFGQRGRSGGGFGRATKGEDVSYKLEISLLEAAKGGKKRVMMGDGQALDLSIPVGIEDGKTLRLKGKGRGGHHGGPPGDALVEIRISPHPLFERRGRDVHVDLPIGLGEAALGGKIDVPTIDGTVTMTIPKGANSGTTLRLKGRGIPGPKGRVRGNQYVRLKVVMPKTIDGDLRAFLERWSKDHPYDPRA